MEINQSRNVSHGGHKETSAEWWHVRKIITTMCLKHCIKASRAVTDTHGCIKMGKLLATHNFWKGLDLRVYARKTKKMGRNHYNRTHRNWLWRSGELNSLASCSTDGLGTDYAAYLGVIMWLPDRQLVNRIH